MRITTFFILFLVLISSAMAQNSGSIPPFTSEYAAGKAPVLNSAAERMKYISREIRKQDALCGKKLATSTVFLDTYYSLKSQYILQTSLAPKLECYDNTLYYSCILKPVREELKVLLSHKEDFENELKREYSLSQGEINNITKFYELLLQKTEQK